MYMKNLQDEDRGKRTLERNVSINNQKVSD
jgi:hypothetical protein